MNPQLSRRTFVAGLGAVAAVSALPALAAPKDAIADIHQLSSGKNVVEIYDRDKNRVEVMEPPKTSDKASL